MIMVESRWRTLGQEKREKNEPGVKKTTGVNAEKTNGSDEQQYMGGGKKTRLDL